MGGLGLLATGAVATAVPAFPRSVTFAYPDRENYVVTVGSRLSPFPRPGGTLAFTRDSPVYASYLTREAQIIISSSRRVIAEREIIPTLHRSGDHVNLLRRAVQRGISGIDMDASDIDGQVYIEHGSIMRVLGMVMPLCVDGDEKRIAIGAPTPLEQRIRLIAAFDATIADPTKRLVVIIEAKNGRFSPATLKHVHDTIVKHDIAGIIFGRAVERFLHGRISS